MKLAPWKTKTGGRSVRLGAGQRPALVGEKRVGDVRASAGIAEIEGRRVDVESEGELIDAGQIVEVTHVDGNRIVVRRLPHINGME